MARKKKIVLAVVAPLALMAALIFFYPNPFGDFVFRAVAYGDTLQPSGAIVVLGGASSGVRMRKGVELFKAGYGQWMVFSGNEIYPGYDRETMMKKYAVSLGVPKNKIVAKKIGSEISTWGEAITNLDTLKEMGIKKFILVTSAYHSRRSYKVYCDQIALGDYDMEIRSAPAPDPDAPENGWWKIRSGQNLIFNEYVKSLYYLINY